MNKSNSMTYHIRIKKEYASAIIEDLQKNDAVELVPEEEAFEVPEWQKEEVRKRIEKYKNNPEMLLDEDTFFKMLKED
jgi:hypothetical protein